MFCVWSHRVYSGKNWILLTNYLKKNLKLHWLNIFVVLMPSEIPVGNIRILDLCRSVMRMFGLCSSTSGCSLYLLNTLRLTGVWGHYKQCDAPFITVKEKWDAITQATELGLLLTMATNQMLRLHQTEFNNAFHCDRLYLYINRWNNRLGKINTLA